jgi:hypothetical protein
MERFYELSEDTEKIFNNVFNKKAFPLGIKLQFICDTKQKNLIKISKIPDDYSFVLNKELKVTINENLIDVYDEESVEILFEQEIDKIQINMESGKIKMIKTDLNTFSSLVNKYGVEKIARANKVEELYRDQQKDANDEAFLI